MPVNARISILVDGISACLARCFFNIMKTKESMTSFNAVLLFSHTGHVSKCYFSLLAQTGHGNKLAISFYLIAMTSLYFSTLSLRTKKQIS